MDTNITTDELLAEYARLDKAAHTIPQGWATVAQLAKASGRSIRSTRDFVLAFARAGGPCGKVLQDRQWTGMVDLARFMEWRGLRQSTSNTTEAK
jgi:hypothetical protein